MDMSRWDTKGGRTSQPGLILGQRSKPERSQFGHFNGQRVPTRRDRLVLGLRVIAGLRWVDITGFAPDNGKDRIRGW